MSTVAVNRVAWDAHLRDLRHMQARAASALADWLEYLTVEGKAAGTLYQYTRQVAPLLRAFPDKELREITAADINHVLGRVPERSRYITRSIYNAWFQWAEDEGLLEFQPMRRVPKMRQPHRRPRDIYSEVEVEKLSALGFPYGQLARVMFGTGLRRGECRSLRRSDVNLDRARLMVYHSGATNPTAVQLQWCKRSLTRPHALTRNAPLGALSEPGLRISILRAAHPGFPVPALCLSRCDRPNSGEISWHLEYDR